MSIRVIDTQATCININRILKERNITAKEVRDALQLDTVQAVYKWLSPNNKTIPSLDSLFQLAHYLDLAVEDIVVLQSVEQ